MTDGPPRSSSPQPKPISKDELSAGTVHGFFKEHRKKSPERKRPIPEVRECEELAGLANRLRAEWVAIRRYGKVFERQSSGQGESSMPVFSKEKLENRLGYVRKAAINLKAAIGKQIDDMALSLAALVVEEARPSPPVLSGFAPYAEMDSEKGRASSWIVALESSLEEAKEFSGRLDRYIETVLPEDNGLAVVKWYELGARGFGLSPVEKIQGACIEALKTTGVGRVSRDAEKGPVAYVTARILSWVYDVEISPSRIRALGRKTRQG